MGIVDRLDLLAESLPRTCMYCKWGANVVAGPLSCLDRYACMLHAVEGLRGKRVTAPPPGFPPQYGRRVHMPIMFPDETCDGFEPIGARSRKFALLDLLGMFDEVPDSWIAAPEGARPWKGK